MHDAVPDQHDQGNGSGSPDEPEIAAGRSFPDLDAVGIALEAGRVGVWSWDIESNAVKWSANMEQIHGAPGGSFDGTFTAFQKDIHPEDRPEVSAAVQESVRSGKPYHVHYRLAPQADKEERWVEAMASVIQENGMAVRMLGTCRGVTDR